MTTGNEPAAPASTDSSMPLSRKIKIAIWALCVILGAIILWQNWIIVDVKFLFITIQMPRTILVLIILAVGFVTGLVTPSLWARRRKTA